MRSWEWMSWGLWGLSKRIAFPVPACVWLWRVGSLVFVRCTMDGSPLLSRLRCGLCLSLPASDIARRHRGWRSPGSQVSLYMAVSHLPVCNCWWLHHPGPDTWRGGSSPWSSDHHTSPRSVLRRIDDNGRTSQCPVVCGLTLLITAPQLASYPRRWGRNLLQCCRHGANITVIMRALQCSLRPSASW